MTTSPDPSTSPLANATSTSYTHNALKDKPRKSRDILVGGVRRGVDTGPPRLKELDLGSGIGTTSSDFDDIQVRHSIREDGVYVDLDHVHEPSTPASASVDPEKCDIEESEVVEALDSVQGDPAGGGRGGNEEDSLKNQTREQKRLERIQFVALCWSLFMAGWNDATIGPLNPRIREFYNIGFAVVSLFFLLACLGFTIGALVNIPLTDRYGFGKVIFFGALCQVVAYAIQSIAPPYPVFLLAAVLNGAGLAVQDAQANGFVASLKTNPEAKMGLLHAVYGFGALVCPLVATQFAQMQHWSFHYIVSASIALSNAIFLGMVFRLRPLDVCLAQIGQPVILEPSTSEKSTFKQIMGLRVVHLMAFFILVYVGVEVTFGGWIVTYVLDVRGGRAASGYVSSGFFGGLMFGRVALLWVNKKVGERRVLFIYAILAIAFDLVIWLVPSLIASAVSVTIIGMLLGPMYPIAMNYTGRVIPHRLLTGSIGWIAGLGQAGSALLPFMTGAISGRLGITSMHPLLIIMMVIMLGLWAIVPTGVTSGKTLDQQPVAVGAGSGENGSEEKVQA